MSVVLDKRYTKADTTAAILRAISKLASDKNTRLLWEDQQAWMDMKMREIRRLTAILRERSP